MQNPWPDLQLCYQILQQKHVTRPETNHMNEIKNEWKLIF